LKIIKPPITLCLIFVLMSLQICFAQDCDNCITPTVSLYDVELEIPQPPFDTLHTYYGGSANYQAYLHWLDLSNVSPAYGIMNNDPKKNCVEWMGGTFSEDLAAADTTSKVTIKAYQADIPHDGPIGGAQYLIWGILDSADGSYRIRMFLEDAKTRDQIAVGEQTFTKSEDAFTAGDAAAAQLEPVFDKIRAYQEKLRDENDNIAIHAIINVAPDQSEIKMNETDNVKISVYDCDGNPGDHPLKNRWIKIKTDLGHFDLDSVETDDNGEANVLFHADNESGTATINAVYYPYTTAYHEQNIAFGNAVINVDYVPTRNWVLTLDLTFTTTNSVEGSTNGDGSSSKYEEQDESHDIVHGDVHVVGDFDDTTASIEETLYSNLTGSKWQTSSSFYSSAVKQWTGDVTHTLETQNTTQSGQLIENDFVFVFGNTYPSGISFTCITNSSLAYEYDDFFYTEDETPPESKNQSSTLSDSSGYVTFWPGMVTPTTASYSGNKSGYDFEGQYHADSSSIDYRGYNVTQTLNASVSILIKPDNNITSIKGKSGDNTIPQTFILFQNYPNPFNPTTIISYSIPKSTYVSIKIYDALGREVKTLVKENKSPGTYNISFNGAGLSSGVYFYKMQAGSFVQTKKLLLIK
jgi:Secretion system C-terminal sorting domain